MNGKWLFVIKRTFVKRNNRCRRRRLTEKKTNPQLYLPHELIIQILLRLPVKSLIRFKCVCKSWFFLISDPHFANSHFQLSSGTHTRRILLMSTSRPRRILLMSTSPTLESRSINFEASSLEDDSAYVSLYPNFIPLESDSYIKVKGSCRGFILLHCYSKQMQNNSIYLWNPSTGFHKKIPLSPFASHPSIQYYTNFYGFGYDQSTDDYLLVTLSYEVYHDPQLPHLEFFPLRANTWKEIEGTQFTYIDIMRNQQPAAGFLFNGTIHWFAHSRELQDYVIVAFDLMEKKLFNIHLPDDFDSELIEFGFWVFGEFLSVWALRYIDDVHENYNMRLEIWVMKEYKVDSPWTKTLIFGYDVYNPLCSTKSGDIIGTDGQTLFARYNDDGNLLEFRDYLIDGQGCEVALYIESLLLLPDSEQT